VGYDDGYGRDCDDFGGEEWQGVDIDWPGRPWRDAAMALWRAAIAAYWYEHGVLPGAEGFPWVHDWLLERHPETWRAVFDEAWLEEQGPEGEDLDDWAVQSDWEVDLYDDVCAELAAAGIV